MRSFPGHFKCSHAPERDVTAAAVLPELTLLAIVLTVSESNVNDGLGDHVLLLHAEGVGGENEAKDSPVALKPVKVHVEGGAEHVDQPGASVASVRVVVQVHLEVWVEGQLASHSLPVEGEAHEISSDTEFLLAASEGEDARAPDEGVSFVVEWPLPTVANVSVDVPGDLSQTEVNHVVNEHGLGLRLRLGGGSGSESGDSESSFHPDLNYNSQIKANLDRNQSSVLLD